jgi:FemAB-related protein (PEP-CTERM system-associated)
MNAFSPLTGLRVRTGGSSDEAAARAFVEGHPNATLFHRLEWAQAVERGCGAARHLLLAEDGSGALRGLLVLSEVRSPLFGASLVSAGFGVSGGVLGEGADALAKAAWDLAQRLGCQSVELRGSHVPAGYERHEGTYANFSRALPCGADAILKSIPRKQRAEVRRAEGFGLSVAIGRDVDSHYRVYSESVRNLGTPVFPRALFEEMLGAFGNDADILTVSKDGAPLASVLSLYDRGIVHPYWGGGTAQARTWRANEAMYFHLMVHAAQRGCTRFDFGRSKLGTGAFAFKKNWGFEPEPLVYATRGEARETNPLSPRYRLQVALWKKLPLALANRLGPSIARGLG